MRGNPPSPFIASPKRLSAFLCRKYNVAVDFDGYKIWRAQQRTEQHVNGDPPDLTSTARSLGDPQVSSSAVVNDSTSSGDPLSFSEQSAPYPTSFSQIIDLITNGQPIPGLKEVPDTLLTGQGSQPTTVKRKKPWERDKAGIVGEGNEVGSTSIAQT